MFVVVPHVSCFCVGKDTVIPRGGRYLGYIAKLRYYIDTILVLQKIIGHGNNIIALS